MNRKYLEELLTSIEDETIKKDIIDKIMTKNGEQIESHKTEVATLKNDLKVKDGLIDNLNAKIKENSEIDIEAIKKEQFDLGKAEGNKETEIFKKNIALEKALSGTKAKDIKLIEKMLDNEKLSYELKDGNYEIKGLDEQIKGIEESHSYLFDGKEETSGLNLGGNHENKTPENNATNLLGALKEKYGK